MYILCPCLLFVVNYKHIYKGAKATESNSFQTRKKEKNWEEITCFRSMFYYVVAQMFLKKILVHTAVPTRADLDIKIDVWRKF